jgi:hypothetical protein
MMISTAGATTGLTLRVQVDTSTDLPALPASAANAQCGPCICLHPLTRLSAEPSRLCREVDPGAPLRQDELLLPLIQLVLRSGRMGCFCL